LIAPIGGRGKDKPMSEQDEDANAAPAHATKLTQALGAEDPSAAQEAHQPTTKPGMTPAELDALIAKLASNPRFKVRTRTGEALGMPHRPRTSARMPRQCVQQPARGGRAYGLPWRMPEG
jgi:hypothetical protein